MRVYVLWIILALLVGLVLGGWGPRLDLQKAREDMKSLEARRAKAAARPAELAGLRNMLRLPEGDHEPLSRAGRRNTTNGVRSVATEPPPMARQPDLRAADTSGTDRAAQEREGISKASELWMTRVALARNAFVSNAGLDEEQEKSLDVLLEAMNLRLGHSIDRWVEQLKTKGTIQPEDGIRMVNEISSILVLTYSELDRTLPPDWRQKAGENFQLVNFIDPDAVMPLMDLESMGTNTPWAAEGRPLRRRRVSASP